MQRAGLTIALNFVSSVALHFLRQVSGLVLGGVLLKVASLVSSLLVGGELMVEARTHQIVSSLIRMYMAFIVMKFHNGVTLVIVMSLTPDIMFSLRTLSSVMMTRVLGSIEGLYAWLQSNRAVSLTCKSTI